jgi:hypothetical protein
LSSGRFATPRRGPRRDPRTASTTGRGSTGTCSRRPRRGSHRSTRPASIHARTYTISSFVSDGPPAPAGSKQLFGWGFPLYFGRSTDPLYRIVLRETRFTYGQRIDGHRIHAPSGMQPSNLSDGVMYVIDQVDGYTYRSDSRSSTTRRGRSAAWHAFRLETYGSGFNTVEEPADRVAPDPPRGVGRRIRQPPPSGCTRGACRATASRRTRDRERRVSSACPRMRRPGSPWERRLPDLTHEQIDALSIPVWQKAICKGLADHGALVGFNGSDRGRSRSRLRRTAPRSASRTRTRPSTPVDARLREGTGRDRGWGAHLKVLAPFPRPG